MQEENAPEAARPAETPPGGNGTPAGQDRSLEEMLAEAQAKVEEQREAMLRAVAEAENVKRRVQAEAAAAQKFAVEKFAEGLLPVADSLEAALAAASQAPQALREGIELTLRQLKSAFERSHLREIAPAAGEKFDPHRHQAMAAVPSPGEPNTVVSVMQKGYALHERILRPALVTVARPVEKAGKNPTSGVDPD